MYDVAVIGTGIIGAFISRELSKYKLKLALIEKDNDISNGTTKANSAIIHAGYDPEPGTKMAKFNAEGNPMFDSICEELDVPFKRIGSLVVAFDDEDMIAVRKLYIRGLENGIPGLRILDEDSVKEMEPNISGSVIGALFAPTCGIVGPWELAIALVENAMENGTELFLNSEVSSIHKLEQGYKIKAGDNEIDTRYVINCAGVYADDIHNMVSSPKYKITPQRGQYFILDKIAGSLFNKVIFQCPTTKGKGVLVAPTVHGNVIIGPDKEEVEGKNYTETTGESLAYVKERVLKTSEKIPFNHTITTFSGLRAETDVGDFIIEEVEDAKGFIEVAGIKSPGLSASPAIARYVVELIGEINGGLEEKETFNPTRKRVVRFNELSKEEKIQLIKKNPQYGRIVCRCEGVTEGEIVDAINRKAGATTLDGVKRRARPGSGRCQGGFCGPRVMEILARELNKDIADIVKDDKDSYILTGPTKSLKLAESEV